MQNDHADQKAALVERMGNSAAQQLLAIEADFPHVFRHIADAWGTGALDAYFKELMLPQRDGRAGFPPDTATAIMRLAALHGKLGLTREPPGSIWQWASDSDLIRSGQT